jgi:hypothetical protein
MRFATFLSCLLLSAIVALGANVGDTYDQVIAENGKPKSQMEAGPMRILTYPDAVIKLRDNVVISIRQVAAAAPAQAAPSGPTATPSIPQQIATWKRKLDEAVAEVVAIINQPLPSQPRPPEMRLTGGLFHDGATRPNFNTVDIRKTQEGMFDAYDFITWEGKPDLMWVGKDTEFNAMTKYFYLDRSLPKKKLTEAEMLEINRLYRVIGLCEQNLSTLGYLGTVP